MLLEELGFRPAAAGEIAGARERQAATAPAPGAPAGFIPAAVLSARPFISYSGMTGAHRLGLAGAAGDALRGREAWFLLSPTWSIEAEGGAGELRRRAVSHRLRHPDHRLIFVANSSRNTEELRQAGEAAFFFNKTATVPEWIFRPLPVRREFDAIYNAQLVPWKRHELTLATASCAFIFHSGIAGPAMAEARRDILRRHAACPGHMFLNRFDEGGVPIRFLPEEVAGHLNRARVGLCLSEAEGAMFAGTEYLLAGLPIVTTPSVGGRDAYFDPEFCLTVPAEPAAVAAAVQALKERQIPPDYIRTKTLQRIGADRARFMDLLNRIRGKGGSGRAEGAWPFRKPVTMQWLRLTEAVDRAAHRVVDGYDPDDPLTSWRIRRWLLHKVRRLTGRQ